MHWRKALVAAILVGTVLGCIQLTSAALVTSRWNAKSDGVWSGTLWDGSKTPISSNATSLKFNAQDTFGYTSTNDMDDGSGGPFVLNRIKIEGQSNQGDRTYTITGNPVQFRTRPEISYRIDIGV